VIGPAPFLGRNCLVSPGQPSPKGWEHCARVAVALDDESLPTALAAMVHERRAVVLELADDVETALNRPSVTSRPPYELGARFPMPREALRALVFGNSVDYRRASPGWWLIDAAQRLGARAVDDGHGDVVLADGARLWLDGGPPRFTAPIEGVGVLHRVCVEHGSLAPPLGNSAATTSIVGDRAGLAADQLAAVIHDGGSARIIAPAGSGKTRVLTERARHLVRQWRVPASAMTLIAFNKRAQEEIVARTADLPGLQVRTLNSLALAVLNGTPPFARRSQRVNTIDEPEVRRLIGRMVKFPRVRNADPVATWIEALALARLGLVPPDEVEARYEGDVDGFTEVFPRYRAALVEAGTVDYDEQVFAALELLLRDPPARAGAQRACRVLLVDEFQDLTPAHLLLVRLLAGADGAVFGVGDDDQTIYGYNGADPAWLIDFADIFPGAGDHPLEVNYRCPRGIVIAADTLLRHNQRRVAKIVRAAHTDHDGFSVAPATGDPVAVTVQAVTTALAAGAPTTDIAVLTRVNSLLAPVQVALGAQGIATNGGVGREFVERTAVRATLAWLRLACTQGDLEPDDVGEALRRPSRSLHPRVAEWVGEQRSVAAMHRLAERVNNDKDAARVGEFADDIGRLAGIVEAKGTTVQVLTALRDTVGLAGSIAKLDLHRQGMNRAAQNDDLTALAQLALLQPDPRRFEAWLRAALGRPRDATGVTLATVHRVKGQEWPMVVVHHADADQFPHRLAEDIEEERRLFHVAITRAGRDVLVVPSDRPSPFIAECSSEPPSRPAKVPESPTAAQQVGGTRSPGATASRRSTGTGAAPATKPGDGLSAADAALFAALRDWRRHVAAGKPAYTVLSDRTLHDLAVARPASLDALAAVRGIGPAKLAQYGTSLLDLIVAQA
jgi:DNA helicase-2/ATP-dependent DNA helicase PcrA